MSFAAHSNTTSEYIQSKLSAIKAHNSIFVNLLYKNYNKIYLFIINERMEGLKDWSNGVMEYWSVEKDGSRFRV